MKTIAHLSDLHFGAEDLSVAESLLSDLTELSPSLVVISGDLTQKATRSQFRAAARFVGRIPFPTLIVPGNHDIPAYNLPRRLLSPLREYKRHISADLAPLFVDDEMVVMGINTARWHALKEGRISRSQIRHMEEAFASLPQGKLRVLVAHHPLMAPPDWAWKSSVKRPRRAVEAMERCGIDLVLSGHLHRGFHGDIRAYYPSAKRSIVLAQAGTAIGRWFLREPNTYNVISLSRESISVGARAWDGSAFAAVRDTTAYVRPADTGGGVTISAAAAAA